MLCLIITVKDKAVVDRMSLNDNKAGMDGLDKDRINQIIHEASKGKPDNLINIATFILLFQPNENVCYIFSSP